uniref:Putative secreted protein n=1 Tax=Ixodes ricinus TaxID=34613 RepID=A0A147BAL9_IXORI
MRPSTSPSFFSSAGLSASAAKVRATTAIKATRENSLRAINGGNSEAYFVQCVVRLHLLAKRRFLIGCFNVMELASFLLPSCKNWPEGRQVPGIAVVCEKHLFPNVHKKLVFDLIVKMFTLG